MPIDWTVFHQNRAAIPAERLVPYQGGWVAWSFDGTQIVAHSTASEEAVEEMLRARGEDPTEYLISYIEGPQDELLGPILLNRLTPEQRARLVNPE